MKKYRIWMIALTAAVIAAGCSACGTEGGTPEETEDVQTETSTEEITDVQGETGTMEDNTEKTAEVNENAVTYGSLPEELAQIPEEYWKPSEQPGTLTELEYDTYESMTYEEQSQVLHKRAIVYLPYGYSEEKQYNVFYLMHGGWSNETTYLGTPDAPSEFKNILDNGIADGRIREMIVVCPTYNNTSGEDSSNYSLALRLTENYHNELVNDLIPAVESTYSTYADDTTPEGLQASRDHRAFCGFSMGSVATWRTFQYCLDYFRYFMPSSGSITSDGESMASMVRDSGHEWDDFFIFAASGTEDFAYSSFKNQIQAMADVGDGTFRFADNEREGNLYFLEQEGGTHSGEYAEEYFYNGLCWIWSGYTLTTKAVDVINDPVFEDYGRLIFPVDRAVSDDLELQDVGDILVWYNNVNPERTVEIANYLRDQAAAGNQIFYDIYTEEEKAEDPDKEDTGLFFFRGEPGAETAIVNAGGGFMYVAAMHDSFPHALELSKNGYNAFALIYRPGAQTACEDLARAIAFLYEHAEELEIDMTDYSLWGGSAGARMAAWLGSYGTESFGEQEYPRPAAVIMQYTGLSEVTGEEPPTYACVGTSDGIASYRSMEDYIRRIQADGTDAEIEVFDGLRHGFGLGEGTIAEGWIDHAIAFWERQILNE